MPQVAQRLGQPPPHQHRPRQLAVEHRRDHLEGGPRAVRQRAADALEPLVDGSSVGLRERSGVADGPAVPREDELDVEQVDDAEAPQELAGRVRRVAVVVVERDATEQVVAGQQQPAPRLVEDHVRRRVAGRLVHLPGTEIGLDFHARQQRAVRQHDLGDAEAPAAALLLIALEIGRGHAALTRYLDAALELPLGVARGLGHVFVIRVHPQLAAGGLDNRRGEPVVVGMGMRADEQAHVLEPEPGLIERALQLSHRPRLVQAGVDEYDAAAGSDREGVHVRNAGPRQRQAQAP